MPHITRREFLQDSSALAAGLTAAGELGLSPTTAGAAEISNFTSRFPAGHGRVWLGPDYWANPLQDWRVARGRMECIHAAPDRNVHLLTRQLGSRKGRLSMTVRIGRVGDRSWGDGEGSAGFRLGIQGPLREYRNSLIFGKGLNAGIAANRGLFIGNPQSAEPGAISDEAQSVELRLVAEPDGEAYTIRLSAHDPETGKQLGQVRRQNVSGDQLIGNVALVANFGSWQRRRGRGRAARRAFGKFWFADWSVTGDKVEVHADRAFGPILFSQYTLSQGILKMTAQMPPLGEQDSSTVRLQIDKQHSGDWSTIAEEAIHSQSRTATFRIENWDDKTDIPYRLAYTLAGSDEQNQEHYWTGTIRRDPVDEPILTVADISCNIHAAFPNALYVANMAKRDPDFLAFVGDQFYESTGGYGVVRQPLETAILDYLRKWYLHGWTWREVMRDRPSIALPDDHDVYQGNIWGEQGHARQGTQEMGGYDMHAEWVNVVHRTQTSHHPDPHDPTPIQQDINVYYGPLTYGRVSFAILADRMFKTGPEGVVPPTQGRGDHVTNPDFDPKSADVPEAELLGERQMTFLREWASDWSGADMKAVISQTIFTGMATTHGPGRQRLRVDYDCNAWPQTPRNQALREIRKAFAVHLAGDQHLPAVVQYGIDTHRDAAVAFAGPAVNVGYPRWWEPTEPGRNREPGAPENTGDFTDHLGHPLTVLAVANGAVEPRGPVLEKMHDKASGLGLVRFDKVRRTVTFECWPYLADPTASNTQFPGWPVTVDVLENYGRKPAGYLPKLEITGIEKPVVQVVGEADGEIVYTLRLPGPSFQPMVFADGHYTVRISEPESGRKTELTGLKASPENATRLQVEV